MKKGHWLNSVFKNKCPRCHEGEFYPYANPYNLKHLTKTNDNCEVCGLNLEVEPGFYFGAMYISYALATGSGLVLYAILSEMLDMGIWTLLTVVLVYLIITAPLFYRLSRLAWINIFIHYKEKSEWEGKVKENPTYHKREE